MMSKKKRALALISMVTTVLFLTVTLSLAEIKAQPLSKNYKVLPLEMVDVLEITGLDVNKAIAENMDAGPDKGPHRVGLAAKVEIITGAPNFLALPQVKGQIRGTWEELESGLFMWRLRVSSPGARWLSFGFTKYKMPRDASLYAYTPDYQWVAGPYTSKDNEAHGQLWTPMIFGDEAVLELTIKETSIKELQLVLGSVTHGYRGMGTEEDPAAKSGSCNVDVICPEGDDWRDQIRSVGHYLLTKGSSTYVCTGSLINNYNNDATAYFLTANHCVSMNTVAATVVIYWEYESDTCRTPGSAESGTPIPKPSSSQTGSALRATYQPSDFTLLELDDPPEPNFDVYWSGWDRTGTNPSSAVCIHHPSGHAKRISHENNPLTTTSYLDSTSPGDGTHLRVADWDSGTTEDGSSGAGLWDPSRRIVGQLHGGYAACGNNEADWIGKLSISWTGGSSSNSRLSDWLDPTASGVNTLDGHEGGDPPPTDDHGDTPATATPIGTDGTSVAGVIAPGDDEDWFSFDAIAGNEYLIATGDSLDTVISLIDSDGVTELAWDDDGGPEYSSLIAWTCITSGTYYVKVESYDTDMGSYTLSVEDQSGSPKKTNPMSWLMLLLE